jgi:hypothetical protein
VELLSWIGVLIAVVAGAGGVLYAVHRAGWFRGPDE